MSVQITEFKKFDINISDIIYIITVNLIEENYELRVVRGEIKAILSVK
jgi:hypothetical protein